MVGLGGGVNGMAIAEVFGLSSVWAIALVAEVWFLFGCNSCTDPGTKVKLHCRKGTLYRI